MDSVDNVLRHIYILAAFVVLKTIKKVTRGYGRSMEYGKPEHRARFASDFGHMQLRDPKHCVQIIL